MVGCGDLEREISPTLHPLKNCGEVEQAIREAAMDEMDQRIDQNLKNALSNMGSRCGGYGYSEDSANRGGAPAPQAAGMSNPSSKGGGASQVSTTNNQVAGVDEADFVKNDNKYIYIVTGKHFRIIEAWPAALSKEIAKVEVEGTPRKLFVSGDRALIYSSLPLEGSSKSSYYRSECTYGYSCSFTGDGKPTLITFLDISDRAAPKKVRMIKLTGSYVNARRVGDAVFTVLSSPGISFPGLKYYPPINSGCGTTIERWEIIEAYDKLRAENRKIIQETSLKDWLPSINDHILAGNGAGTIRESMTGCKGFYKSTLSDGRQFSSLLAVNMSNNQPATASTIVSMPGAVYASAKALYISVPHQHQSGTGWYRGMSNVQEASTVHKFVLNPKEATAGYAGSGVVKGRVLNQFSMDEYQDHLRIATTNGRVPSPTVHSTLSILQQQGGALVLTGAVDNLAPKEDIRSVRFDGGRSFMVTFKKTDPLFVFDLSNPRKPQVLAELKIPGFSTYMHMMDEHHLLTIGYDANEQGSFAWFTGVMLQIFDVSNLKNPMLIHKEVIGTRGSSSAALNNHLAFNYFAPKDLLAIPMTVCEGSSGGGSYGKDMTFSGLMVFDTTAQSGFSRRGQVSHPAGSDITCSNWWTNAKSQVERSIIMDDYVFSVSKSLIKVNSLKDLPTDLVSLSIAD